MVGFELATFNRGRWNRANLNGSKVQYLNDDGEYIDICTAEGFDHGQMKTFDCDVRTKAIRLCSANYWPLGLAVFRVYGI